MDHFSKMGLIIQRVEVPRYVHILYVCMYVYVCMYSAVDT
jgi:hypothetical protein